MYRRAWLLRKIASVIAGAILFAACWFFLGPQALGGSVSYVMTSGNSMEPKFHTGDMVLVRTAADYEVGDVVAYRSKELDSVVLHRIVARHGDTYSFKGDNNELVDNTHASAGDIVGRQWLLVPRGGKILQFLLTPRIVSILVSFLAFIFFWNTFVPVAEEEREGPFFTGVPTTVKAGAFTFHLMQPLRHAGAVDGGWSE
jgi:signal peptidase I